MAIIDYATFTGPITKLKKSLDSGMQYAAGGIGNKVADAAIKFAAKNEEDAWESEDTIY